MEITGKLLQLLATQTGSGKNGTWKKQEFVIETGDNYPKKVCIAAWGDKIDLSKFTVGQTLKVSFDVESREYNGKWYTDVKAWNVQGGEAAKQDNFPDQAKSFVDNPDDLPF